MEPLPYATTYWHAEHVLPITGEQPYVLVSVRDFRSAATIQEGKWKVAYISCPSEYELPSAIELCRCVQSLQKDIDNGYAGG